MGKILIIGAGGKVGRFLARNLSETGLSTVAMVRNKGKCNFPESIDVVEGDLEQDFSHIMDGCSTVIFTAGSGGKTGLDKTFLVDLWGAKKPIDFAKESNIKHFIMVSSRGADHPDLGPVSIKPYLIAKHFADEYLIHSGLNYTVLRPGELIDDLGTGLISIDRPTERQQQIISREDTAKVIQFCIENPVVNRKIYELYKGDGDIKDTIK